MDYRELKLTSGQGAAARERYFAGVQKLVEEKLRTAAQARAQFVDPRRLADHREEYRQTYTQMLGWPLTQYREGTHCPFEKELLEVHPALNIYRLSLETLPGVWYQGILYEPTNRRPGGPLIINHPGGGYFAEDLIAHGEYACDQYKNITGRILDDGVTVFAPQNMIWNDKEHGLVNPQHRNRFDALLKAVGGSFMALEIYHVRCAIDFFIANEPIDPTRIGMMGLSYGGFYTLYAAAAEPRVKCAFVSCAFFDRFRDPITHNRPDLFWQDSACRFGEAEVAALIAPRALYLENGVEDPVYPYAGAQEEFVRLEPYYEAAGAADRLTLFKSAGSHEIADTDAGIDFLRNYLA